MHRDLSFSKRVFIGLGAGILAGLFLGDYAGAFKWPAEGFVRLLQTTVFPYLLISIINNLGRLEPRQARSLAVRVGAVIVVLWLITLTIAFALPLSFPRADNASFFSTTLLQPQAGFDFLGLYVPSNPFYALANSIVPAIVLFSLLMGVALMTTARKASVLNVLEVLETAISRATRMIMRLTPLGLFFIAANAAGTLDIEQFGHIEIYLIAYGAVGALIGLWILPGLIAAVTPLTVREILTRTHEPVITAATAGDVFIVLPALIDATKDLLSAHDRDPQETDLPEVIVPTAYNLPHSGKLLSLSFILFAGWYSDAPLRLIELPRLAITGVLTLFGSINGAIPFLLDTFRVPADSFQLFVAMSVVNSRVGSFVAAIHTIAVALLGSVAVSGHLQIRFRRLARYAIASIVLTAAVIGGLRLLFETVLAKPYNKDQIIMTMQPLSPPVPAVVLDRIPPHDNDQPGGTVLDAIRQRGRLRVGYAPDAMPFAFTNAKGQFVGHDVDLAHLMARELGVTLEFVPLNLGTFARSMQDGSCDLAMSGIPITTTIASDVLFSNSYLSETLAFVVPDPARHDYETWESIRRLDPLVISVIDVPYFVDRLATRVPNARLVKVTSVSQLFAYNTQGVDAALLTAERGSTWTLLHPEWSVVVPQPDPIKIPLAIAVARRDPTLAGFVNSWIELKRQDGTLERMYRHWILGADAVPKTPHWSIVRSVLHWTR